MVPGNVHRCSPCSFLGFLLVSWLLTACDRPTQAEASQLNPIARPVLPAQETGADTKTSRTVPESVQRVQLAATTGNPGTKSGDLKESDDERPPVDVPRVYAKSRHVWIRSMPNSDVQWIGYLWWGGSAKIRGPERVPGAGCSKEWVPIEPRGWVCVDETRATTNPEDPIVLAIYPFRPRIDSPWPHRYATVHAPLRVYEALPDEATMAANERGYEAHMSLVTKARQSGSSEPFADFLGVVDPSLSKKEAPSLPPLPKGLSEGRTRIVGRSALAYAAEGDFGERNFLLTSDLNWVPRDRVELKEPSRFSGVELSAELSLPLAFFRGHDRHAYQKNAQGDFEELPFTFKKHSWVALEAPPTVLGRVRYYKVKGRDLWVNDREAVIPRPRETTPWGAAIGQPDTTGHARKGRGTWVEASILGGWLVAFEGTTAKYATLISAGRGGTPHPDKDPLETASTPTGWFPIGGKFKTATMQSSSTPIVHADVPWTQNFSGPHALHSAYWHDDWGNLKSAGCVNVSPLDGKWLFEFTEPRVPDGWHGVRYVARYGEGSTLFIIHE